MSPLQTTRRWRGRELLDPIGERLGRIEEIYLDLETEWPEWAMVPREGPARSAFVPLVDASSTGERMTAAFRRAEVAEAPEVGSEMRLLQDEEAALYRHYGVIYSTLGSRSGLADGYRPPAWWASAAQAEAERAGSADGPAGTAYPTVPAAGSAQPPTALPAPSTALPAHPPVPAAPWPASGVGAVALTDAYEFQRLVWGAWWRAGVSLWENSVEAASRSALRGIDLWLPGPRERRDRS